MKLKILIEDKILWSNKYMKIKETDDGYTYMEDMTGKFVAVLAVSEDDKILGRFEKVPPHKDGIRLVSLTGGIEEDEDPHFAAVRELEEEAGISIGAEDLISLGTIRPSKGTNSIGFLFATKVPFRSGKFSGEGDGTYFEKLAYCQFVEKQEAVKAKDPILGMMLLRYMLVANER